MDNETLIRTLIGGSIQRAVHESVAALLVLIGSGAALVAAPTSRAGVTPFVVVAAVFAAVFAGIAAVNRTAANRLDEMARKLAERPGEHGRYRSGPKESRRARELPSKYARQGSNL